MPRIWKNDNLKREFENWYPFIFGIIAVFFYLILFRKIQYNNFDSVLNAVISFASIFITFIGALVTLIFSLINREIVKIIFDNYQYKRRLKKYFIRSCQSGFILVGLSICLLVRDSIFKFLSESLIHIIAQVSELIIKCFWVYIFIYFILSSYRIIALMIGIAFSTPRSEYHDETVSIEEINQVRDKYK